MNKVYQRISDPTKGDCMQAAIATLFGDDYENVPPFVQIEDWGVAFEEYAKSKGYSCDGMLHNKVWGTLLHPTEECYCAPRFVEDCIISRENISRYEGVNGLFFCAVLSPKYFSWNGRLQTHAVICDKDLNVVFDPCEDYKDIIAYPLSSVIGCNGIISIDIINKIAL